MASMTTDTKAMSEWLEKEGWPPVTTEKLTELDLARQIRDLARVTGWLHVHFRPAKTKQGWRTAFSGDPGFPDMVLARRGRVIFAELKMDGKKARPEQDRWLLELDPGNIRGNRELRGVEAYVWTPADFDSIVETLR